MNRLDQEKDIKISGNFCGFQLVQPTQSNKYLLKNYDEDGDIEYFLEVDTQYHDNIHNLHNNLLFLPERMNIEKVEKFVANLHDKNKDCAINIKNLT